ncbi:GNAT family N-acetyltransferase [Streptomyces sp. NPDC059578]|uniref:GNAT family N-acetyltransferase n=1 Tax=unclassified Streptomyces TaxID=2593676 RepID=UPI003669DBB3
MTLEYRTIPEAELDHALDLHYLVFLEKSPEDESRAKHKEALARCDLIGAYEGEDLVGLLAAHDLDLSVPGGSLPTAGVTFVSVAPTHRRRGVLSGMVDELWRRCAEQRKPLAALWVSEATIYGRYGFDPATHAYTVTLDATYPLDLRIEPDGRPLRLVPFAGAPEVISTLHETARGERAGRVRRDDWWWRHLVLPETFEEDEDMSEPRVVTLGDPGEPPAGYVAYRTKSDDEGRGTLYVIELEAESPQVAAALWRYLVSIDLVDKVRAWGRPLDDPLLLFAADRDQVDVTRQFPALWVRLADVPAALEGRTWSAPLDLVLEVSDRGVPGNAGRYRVTAKPDGDVHRARVTRTDEAPDLTLDVRELAACYLGGTAPVELVRAGLLTEHRAGAATLFGLASRTELLPHTADEF